VITRAGNGDTAQRIPEVPQTGGWDELGTRVLSSIVLGTAVIAVVYLGGLVFSAVIILVAMVMIYEWDKLCENSWLGPIGLTHTVFIGATLLFAGADMLVQAAYSALFGMLAVAAIAIYLRRPVLWPVLGVAYIAAPCVSVMVLRGQGSEGMAVVFLSFAVVWVTDSGAYLIGKSVGGPRLAPRISPKKTWAGLVGGTLCGTAAGSAVALLTDLAPLGVLAALSFGLTFAAHAGDLLESALKRHFGAKDSSALIPGHGGILDRVDGLIFVWPAMVIIQFIHGGTLLPWVSR